MKYESLNFNSARPDVMSFDKGKEVEKVISAAVRASIFGLMESPSKHRSAVFGKFVFVSCNPPSL